MSKILIVEDNAESRYLLKQLLESSGHKIMAAENGEEALRLAREDQPEVIISDIMMPVMNGFRLCREIKGDAELRAIPFIFYTATFVEKDDERLAMSLGASRFIIKPTEGERFIQILDEVLKEHQRGTLPVPEEPLRSEDLLLEMYDNSIARKLAETVEELLTEKKALIKSEKRLKEAQELAYLGHWELDLKSKSLEWSDELYRILGLKPHGFDPSYEAFLEAVHPDDRDYVATSHRESLAKKSKSDIEYRVLLKDGTVKYLHERTQSIYDDDGMPALMMGTVQDITERRLAEETLHKSEELYRALFESSPDVVFILATDGTFSSLNKAFETVTGWSRAKWLGRAFTDIIHPEDLHLAMQAFQGVLQGKTPPIFELRILSKSGGHIVAQFTATLRMQDGNELDILGIGRDITELKQSHKKIKINEIRFKELFNNINSAVAVYEAVDGGRDFIFRDFNTAGERMEKIRREDVIGRRVSEVFPGVRDFGLLNVFQRVWKTGVPEEFPITFYHDNRIKGWRENHIYKLPSGEVVAVYDDITERKEAEKALREAYDTINKSSSVAFTWKNEEGWPVEFVSENVAKLFGYTAEEFIKGKLTYKERIHPEDLERVNAEVEAFSGKAETLDFVHEPYRIIARDGSEKIVDDWTFMVRDDDGHITHFRGIVEDITGRKIAEQALRWSELELSIRNRINQIFLTIPDKEMYGEVLNVILETMHSRYGIFGYINENSELVCPSMTRDVWDRCQIKEKDIVFPQEKWGGIWGRAMAEKKTICSNNTLTIPEGHIQITRALDVPIIYKGVLIGNLVVGNKETDYDKRDIKLLEDIADNIAPVLDSRLKAVKEQKIKKQLEAQFHHAQRIEAIGILAGGVAHDFNNLLTAIIGNAQFALDTLPKDDPTREDVEEIEKAGQRGARLTRQLLAFSRRETRHIEILDLNKLILDLDKLLRRLIRENIDMRTTLASDLWEVEADPGQMEQVIMNLVVNARDVMLDGGKLTIETANVELDGRYVQYHGIEGSRGPYVMLSVTDTGLGMDEETKARIFEPFFTTKERGTGTGLGLSTVYGIVKQSGGYIWAYSEPGMGTAMKVYLPRAKGVQAKVKKKKASEKAAAGGEVVLVVEDEVSLRRLAVRSLQRAGYQVLEAGAGEEALQVSEGFEGEIHLLLTDVVMPGMGGKELAERMASLRPQTKVLYMSGYPDGSLSHNEILKSPIDLVNKPFTPDSLCRKVSEALNR